MFVKTMRGEYYPVSAIETMWVGKSDTGSNVDKATIRGVGTETLFYGEVDRLFEATSPTLPALASTFALVEVSEEDGSTSLDKTPVLGWIISPGRGVVPVTIEGVNNGQDGTVPVLMPSGEVVLANNMTHASEEDYLKDLNK